MCICVWRLILNTFGFPLHVLVKWMWLLIAIYWYMYLANIISYLVDVLIFSQSHIYVLTECDDRQWFVGFPQCQNWNCSDVLMFAQWHNSKWWVDICHFPDVENGINLLRYQVIFSQCLSTCWYDLILLALWQVLMCYRSLGYITTSYSLFYSTKGCAHCREDGRSWTEGWLVYWPDEKEPTASRLGNARATNWVCISGKENVFLF